MKIGFFNTVQLETAGGMENFTIETAAHFSTIPGMRVDCLTMDEVFNNRYGRLHSLYFLKKFDPIAINKEPLEAIQQRLGRAQYIKCASVADFRTAAGGYDLIYSRNEITEAFLFDFLAGYHNLPPVVFGCHCPHRYLGATTWHSQLHNLMYSSALYTSLARGAAGFHTISKSDTKAIEKQFPKHPVVQVPNPFDATGYAGKAAGNMCPVAFDKSRFNILWAGRLTEQKGICHLLDIINSLNPELANEVDWHLCGDGELRWMLEQGSRRWKNIHIHGHIDRMAMPAVYANANLFISTSQWGETFAYTPREANSLGLPVVAFNISGYNEIIEHDVNGLLAKSIGEFGEQVRFFAKGGSLDTNIRHFIQKKTNRDKTCRELLRFFQRIVNTN